ncbi:MAG: PQQ-binding-like beta-propeller repeat protein [Planctomycetaceae bacterium]|jgi:outer membrane protein assembly factor BamB|nr:PQQ-binding-like beta-propeller repeat protein [Planctomycetaceae bacterium]
MIFYFRRYFLFFVCVLFCVVVNCNTVVFGGRLLSSRQMERFGLVHVWHNQLPIDGRNAKFEQVVIEGDTLFVVSTDARVHAIDVLTGKTMWSQVMGKRGLQYRIPAANSHVVAVVSNIELFVFDRGNGKLLMYIPLPNTVSVTACVVSENYVYIPMLGGRIIVYPLEAGVAERKFNIETGKFDEVVSEVQKKSTNNNEGGAEDDQFPLSDAPPHTLEKAENKNNTEKINKKTQDKTLSMKVTMSGDLDERDDVVAEVLESFARAKYSILGKDDVLPPKPQFVLRQPIDFPMSTISFGDLDIIPNLATQIVKGNPETITAGYHWEILTWINKEGDFHAASIKDFSHENILQMYKVTTPSKLIRPDDDNIAERAWVLGKGIVSRPALNQSVPYFYTETNLGGQNIQDLSIIGSKSGYVFAVQNRNGEILWHFAASGAVVERIAVIGADVFVPTANGLYNLDVRTGKEKWFLSGIRRFVCASRTRVYVQDKHNYLVVLDKRNGGKLFTLDLRGFKELLFNIETDRLYVIDEAGLIQCFAERQADTADERMRSGVRFVPETRHRLSAAQYVEVMSGKELPDLYWVTELGLTGKSLANEPEQKESQDNDPAIETPPASTETTTTSTETTTDSAKTPPASAETPPKTNETPSEATDPTPESGDPTGGEPEEGAEPLT